MSIHLAKNKNNEGEIDQYMSCITNKCEKKMIVIKKTVKINDDKISIPTIETYNEITKYNYNVAQLKSFAKHFKLKISGNKNELLIRIYSYLYFSSYIIKIQKVFRGLLANRYKTLHGPACINRKLCTNNTDFITLEPIKEINYHQFLSYKDTDGFIYGFDIISLHNLYFKSNKEIKNPYNRNVLPDIVFKNLKSILRLSRILKIHINLHFEDDTQNISSEKAIELRALTLFQTIDSFGHITNPQWFLSLNRNQIIKFVRELSDIWNYRAQLSQETKRNICPPNGDPFRNLSMPYIHTEGNMCNVKKVVLEVLEKLVNNGIDADSKNLGTFYVLGALTLVNPIAATSLPWFYESMNYY
jgi:hypothetical protein